MQKKQPQKTGAQPPPAVQLADWRKVEAGLSVLELLVVLLLFSALTATALTLVVQANKSLQNRLSSSTLTSTGLPALNQMTREIRMAGFPTDKSFTGSAVASYPGIVATPFVTASSYDLVFEADTNGDGVVERIEYVIPAGSTTITRRSTLKNANGTLATSSTASTAFLENVQNQLQGQPLFTWDLDPLSAKPFPQNIRTVYINAILKARGNESGGPINMTFTATCQRMNP
jgi:hypothetical protein